MKFNKCKKDDLKGLVKIAILVIAILMPIALLLFIWINYYSSYSQMNELIKVLSETNQENIDISPLIQFVESNLQFNFTVFISIVDVTIAIWLGLNIYNTLSKGDIARLQKETHEISNILNYKIEEIDKKLYALDKYELISNEDDFNRKIKYCKRMIQNDPSSCASYNLLGIIYYQAKQYGEAIKYYQQAIDTSKNYYYEAEFNKCECNIELGQCEQALSDLKILRTHDSSDYEVPLIMAEASRRLERYGEALKYNDAAKSLSGNNYYVNNMYDCIYFNMKENEKSKKYFEDTLKFNPPLKAACEEAHFYLAEIYKNTDQAKYKRHKKLSNGYIPNKI